MKMMPSRYALSLSQHEYDGCLIAVEGMNGVGKTTLIEHLRNELKSHGIIVKLAKQPSEEARRLPIFKRYVYSPDERSKIEYRALLATLLSDRLQQLHETIRPALASGHFVIMDRYIFTMVAMMRARGYEERWLLDACTLFPRPNAAFLLDAPLDIALSRIGSRSDAYTSYVELDLFSRLQEEFRLFAEEGMLTLLRSDDNCPEALMRQVLDVLDLGSEPSKNRTER